MFAPRRRRRAPAAASSTSRRSRRSRSTSRRTSARRSPASPRSRRQGRPVARTLPRALVRTRRHAGGRARPDARARRPTSSSRRPSRSTCCSRRARARCSRPSTPSSSTRSTRSSPPSAARTSSCRSSASRRCGRAGAPPLQRIGLSATQRPLDEVARLLGRAPRGDARGRSRSSTRARRERSNVRVEVPAVDMRGSASRRTFRRAPDRGGRSRRSIWPYLHERLVELIRAHRSTMVFVNSRRLAERLAAALNEVAGEEIALAHHGSVAREKRTQIEERLKRGELPAIVATSSLELGIDMGADRSRRPDRGAAVGRVGAAAHRPRGPLGRRRVARRHLPQAPRRPARRAPRRPRACCAGQVEETFYPRNPLDVLAQQIVAIAASEPIGVDALYRPRPRRRAVRRAPARVLRRRARHALGPLPVRRVRRAPPAPHVGPHARPLRAREGARRLAVVNGGTIPDRGLYGVFLVAASADGKRARRVGELDEEMVFELREGEVFLLGASSWRVERDHPRPRPRHARRPGEPGKMPFWHGDRPAGRSSSAAPSARSRASSSRSSQPSPPPSWRGEHGLDRAPPTNLVAYLARAARGDRRGPERPDDRRRALRRRGRRLARLRPLAVRRARPRAVGDRRRRAPARRARGRRRDGLVRRRDGLPHPRVAPSPRRSTGFFPAPDEIEAIVTRDARPHVALRRALPRERGARAAAAAPPTRASARRSGRSASARRICSPSPPRTRLSRSSSRRTASACATSSTCPGSSTLLRRVETRAVSRRPTVDTRTPSPFAASLLFSFVANFIYDGDAPLAERRAQALTIDHAQLRELLGEAELRKLLDPDAHRRARARPPAPRRARSGTPTRSTTCSSRSATSRRRRFGRGPTPAARRRLSGRRPRGLARGAFGSGRIAEVAIAGRARAGSPWRTPGGSATRSASRCPRACPRRSSSRPADADGRPRRALRAHARPRSPRATSRRASGSRSRRSRRALASPRRAADASSRASSCREGGTDATSTATPRSSARSAARSLAKLREAVEPVDDAASRASSLAWQAPRAARARRAARRDRAARRRSAPCARCSRARSCRRASQGYRPWDLDALCASGEVVWAGVEPLGASDGRVALYLAEHEPLLAPPAGVAPRASSRRASASSSAGAARSSSPRSRATLGGFPGALLDALWDMVWAGEVTNDTLEPLRTLLGRDRGEPRDGRRHAALGGSPSVRAGRSDRAGEPARDRGALVASLLAARDAPDARRSAGRRSRGRSSIATGCSRARRCTRRAFRAASPPSTTCSRRWRRRAACGAATSSRAAGRRSSRCPARTIASARCRDAPEATETRVLAATDPANPYGAALPWPQADDVGPEQADRTPRAPQRAAGALVVLVDGALLGWLGKSGHTLLTFLPARPRTGRRGGRARGRSRGARRLGAAARLAPLDDRRRGRGQELDRPGARPRRVRPADRKGGCDGARTWGASGASASMPRGH